MEEPKQVAALAFGPCLPSLWLSDSEIALVENILHWMRNGWHHRSCLMPDPATAIAGHSYGALLAGRVAARARIPFSAYVSLSGVWVDWPDTPPRPLSALGVPALFTWGSNSDIGEIQAVLEGANSVLWDQVASPKHRVVFKDGAHWDYLRPNETTCDQGGRGPCTLVSALAADFVALFLSKYVPPQHWSQSYNILIPDSLLPPPISLTLEQQFFAGGHLMGMTLVTSAQECAATHSWETSGGTGTVVLSGS
jgi:hypothetical protein